MKRSVYLVCGIFALLFISSAPFRMTLSSKAISGTPGLKVIAHMGASVEAPENTLSAFKRAQELGARWVELDVRVTADHIPVVAHDPFIGLDYASLGDLCWIKDHTLAQLQTLDLGGWFGKEYAGERIPTLEQVLKLKPDEIVYVVEIKWDGKNFEGDVTTICKTLKRYGKHYFVGCLVPAMLSYIQKRFPEIPLVGIVESEKNVDQFSTMGLKVLALRQQLVNAQRIKSLHAQGIEVWAWTVDDPGHALEFYEMGIDGVITNNVRRMIAYFQEREFSFKEGSLVH